MKDLEKNKEEDYIPFPYEVFPEDIRKLIDELEICNQFNKDFCSLSIISCISTIMGTKYRLRYKETWEVYPNFWLCMVARPGDKKSPTISTMFKELNKINREGVAEGKQLLVRNSTFEALQDILKNNPNGICVYQDEIKSWYSAQKQYQSDRRGEWLSLWSMDPLSFNTRKDGWVYVDIPMINIIGGTQYDFATKMLSGDEDGMVERFLFTMKSNKVLLDGIKEMDPTILGDFYENINRLYRHINIYDEKEIVLFPDNLIPLRNKLRNGLIEFQSKVENNKLSNYLSKLDHYIPRFILLLAYIDKYWCPDIDSLFDDGCPTLVENISGRTYFEKISSIEIKKEHVINAYELSKYFYRTFESLILKTNDIKEVTRISASLDKQVISNKEKSIRMFQEGIRTGLIAKDLGIDRRTIQRYIKEWKEGL